MTIELPYLEVTMTTHGAALKAPMGWDFLERLPEGSRLVVQFAEDRATHPQPVTPAGGEVACWIHSSDLEFLKGYPHEAQAVTGASHGPLSVHLYTNPPVADAALPRGHRVDDGKQLAMIRDTERLDWLEQVAFTTYRTRDPETGRLYSHVTFVNEDKAPRRGITRDSFRESIDAAMQDAALNQRGGA